MNLYSITLFDRRAPHFEVIVALWAKDRWMAYRRGSKCGRVIDIQLSPGVWPLDARKTMRRVRES